MVANKETITLPRSPWQSPSAAQQRPDYRLLYSSFQLLNMFTCVRLVLPAVGQIDASAVLGVPARRRTGLARTHGS